MSLNDKGVGILHPGAMGAAVGRQAVAGGARVLWLPVGRGADTHERAESAGLEAADDMATLAEECSVIISVCPSAFAGEVAGMVVRSAFRGVFVEANAISPDRSLQISALLAERRVTVVDGGIVGPPPRWPGGATRLYLSGPGREVKQVHELFSGSPLEPVPLPGGVGQASALKLAFATYHKLNYLLAAQACALADGHGVLNELIELASQALPNTLLGRPEQLATASPRARGWEPEMREIAAACVSAGIPTDLVEVAASLLGRWRVHKEDDSVTLRQLMTDLRELAAVLPADVPGAAVPGAAPFASAAPGADEGYDDFGDKLRAYRGSGLV